MASKVQFKCDRCGTDCEEWLAWYRKRKNHYCSKECKNAHHKILYGSGLTRKEYEKRYWDIPENKERRKEMSRAAYIQRTKEMGDSVKRMILNRAKARADRDGVPFDITIDDFDIPNECPVLGISLSVHNKKGGAFNSPSLDRHQPNLGYIKGNVSIISKRANLIKQDATYDEILAVAKYVKSFSRRASLSK